MELSAVKTWQWVIVGLVVGLVVGAARSHYRQTVHGNYVEGFGYFLGDQARFESALVEEVEGRRRFHDVTVYRRQIEQGREFETVYLIKGTYFSGPPRIVDGGKAGGWQPTCFVARVPFEPMTDFSSLQKPGGPDWAKKFRAAGISPTVVDFLSVMHEAAGVKYRVAWWDTYPVLVSTGVFLIGIVWPVLINVLTFRRIIRPGEAKGMSLWKVRNRKRVGPSLSEMAVLSVDPPTDDAAEPALTSSEADHSLTPLSTEPVSNTAGVVPGPHREFGAKEDDFYPTERHSPER